MYLQFSVQHEDKHNTNKLAAGQSSNQSYFHVWSPEFELHVDGTIFKCGNE